MAMTSLVVVFDGWLWEVDLLSRTLVGWFMFVIPLCWLDTRTLVYESRWWYLPDVLWAGEVGAGVPLGMYCCMVVQARIGSRSIS